jgi:hypothetical protein
LEVASLLFDKSGVVGESVVLEPMDEQVVHFLANVEHRTVLFIVRIAVLKHKLDVVQYLTIVVVLEVVHFVFYRTEIHGPLNDFEIVGSLEIKPVRDPIKLAKMEKNHQTHIAFRHGL